MKSGEEKQPILRLLALCMICCMLLSQFVLVSSASATRDTTEIENFIDLSQPVVENNTQVSQTSNKTIDLDFRSESDKNKNNPTISNKNQQQFIIIFKNSQDRDRELINQTGAQVVGGQNIDVLPVLFAVGSDSVQSKIENKPVVKKVIEDQVFKISPPPVNITKQPNQTLSGLVSSDTDQIVPWGVSRINGRTASKSVSKQAQRSVTVAVLDTGINYRHPDLDDNVVWGADFAGGVEEYGISKANDTDGHGTAVAGLIAAENNNRDIVGVAPHAKLYNIKVTNNEVARGSNVIRGLDAAVKGPDGQIGTDDDPDIISVSLGGSGGTPGYIDAFESASQHALIVASAGNEGDGDTTTNEVTYPAKFPEIIAVAATDKDDTTTEFSAEGAEIEVAAPGKRLSTLSKDGGLYGGDRGLYSGTSAAAPLVSGTLALMIAENQSASNDEYRRTLRQTAIDIYPPGKDKKSGYGRISADTAVEQIDKDTPLQPEPEVNGEFVDVDADDLAGTGTEIDPYIITNSSELQAIEDATDGHYQIDTDINATGTTDWNKGFGFRPIPRFTGDLNGLNNTIEGLTVTRTPSEAGLFKNISENGSIRNLNFKNIDITGGSAGGIVSSSNNGTIKRVSVTGAITSIGDGNDAGGLVRENYGLIRSSNVSGTVTSKFSPGGLVSSNHVDGRIVGSQMTGTVTSKKGFGGGVASFNTGKISKTSTNATIQVNSDFGGMVGGIVGINGDPEAAGILNHTYALGDIEGGDTVGGLVGRNSNGSIHESYATSDVSGRGIKVGGLVGDNNDIIEESYATGDLKGEYEIGGLVGDNAGRIHESYSTGKVEGTDLVGGLVGDNTHPVTDSYWDIDESKTQFSDGGFGLTTDEMTGESAMGSMDGFDFETTWSTNPDGYPVLNSTGQKLSDPTVVLKDVQISPTSVRDSSSHTLSFTAMNVSADGIGDEYNDEFEVTFPKEVILEDHEVINIDAQYSDVDQDGNTLNFSVSPRGGGITQIFVEVDVTLSPANNK